MSISKPKVLIILANLGTPDAPTVPAVRAFLKQFLNFYVKHSLILFPVFLANPYQRDQCNHHLVLYILHLQNFWFKKIL